MASLTEAPILTRKFVRFAIYGIILIIIVRYAWLGAAAIFTRLNPPEPPKATTAFGKLPVLPFPEKSKLENVVYTLQTTEGTLPLLPELIEVYEMPEIESSIQGLESAKQKAQSFGFQPAGQLVVETVPNVYIFKKQNKPSNFTINIVTGVFSISYDIAADTSVLNQIPPAPSAAIQSAHGFFGRANLDQPDLAGPETTELLRIENGRFVKADSLSEAEITKVNLFRKNFGVKGDIRSVTPDMPESNVWVMFSGSSNEVIAAEYHYFPINMEKYGTYPLKTSDEAWEELKNGKGYIANAGQRSSNEIIVRKVYLAYYDAGQYAKYYQPVVVFEGDNGFMGYVPAVENEYYGTDK
jgi:hypothetical protein